MDYTNVEFPKTTQFVRHSNMLYFSTDPEDGEKLTYYGKCEKPSSNALGYRWYARENGGTRLIRYDDIVW